MPKPIGIFDDGTQRVIRDQPLNLPVTSGAVIGVSTAEAEGSVSVSSLGVVLTVVNGVWQRLVAINTDGQGIGQFQGSASPGAAQIGDVWISDDAGGGGGGGGGAITYDTDPAPLVLSEDDYSATNHPYFGGSYRKLLFSWTPDASGDTPMVLPDAAALGGYAGGEAIYYDIYVIPQSWGFTFDTGTENGTLGYGYASAGDINNAYDPGHSWAFIAQMWNHNGHTRAEAGTVYDVWYVNYDTPGKAGFTLPLLPIQQALGVLGGFNVRPANGMSTVRGSDGVLRTGWLLTGVPSKGPGSTVSGKETRASGNFSDAKGYSSIASGYGSHAEGGRCSASGDNSHAEGINSQASGLTSHAEGNQSTAAGQSSHAEGTTTTASGQSSHAQGNGTRALGYASHVEGDSGEASGIASHSEGSSSTASGDYSHAQNFGNTASGYASHAGGYNTTSSGDYSYAEGFSTVSLGNIAHAEGSSTFASGNYSHSENIQTTASGAASHAEGTLTTASGESSHAQGHRTNAYRFGEFAHSSAVASDGITPVQVSRLTLIADTVDATPTVLTNGNGSGGLELRDNCVSAITGTIVAHHTNNVSISMWTYKAAVRAVAGTYTLVGSATPTLEAQDAGGSTWAVAVTVDPFGLVITVTGDVATNIRWTASAEILENR